MKSVSIITSTFATAQAVHLGRDTELGHGAFVSCDNLSKRKCEHFSSECKWIGPSKQGGVRGNFCSTNPSHPIHLPFTSCEALTSPNLSTRDNEHVCHSHSDVCMWIGDSGQGGVRSNFCSPITCSLLQTQNDCNQHDFCQWPLGAQDGATDLCAFNAGACSQNGAEFSNYAARCKNEQGTSHEMEFCLRQDLAGIDLDDFDFSCIDLVFDNPDYDFTEFCSANCPEGSDCSDDCQMSFIPQAMVR